MKIAFTDLSLPKSGTLVVAATKGSKLTPTAQAVNKATGDAIKRAMAASRFDGKKGEWLTILGPGGIGADRVLVCGLGNADELSTNGLRDLGARAVGKVLTSGAKALTIAMDPLKTGRKQGMADGTAAAEVAYGASLGAYRFDKYRTNQKPEDKPSLTSVTVSDPLLGGTLSGQVETGGTGTNGDSILDVGETWTYTANYTVTQANIDDNGGGDGDIDNTATSTTTEVPTPKTAIAAVALTHAPSYTIAKSATAK